MQEALPQLPRMIPTPTHQLPAARKELSEPVVDAVAATTGLDRTVGGALNPRFFAERLTEDTANLLTQTQDHGRWAAFATDVSFADAIREAAQFGDGTFRSRSLPVGDRLIEERDWGTLPDGRRCLRLDFRSGAAAVAFEAAVAVAPMTAILEVIQVTELVILISGDAYVRFDTSTEPLATTWAYSYLPRMATQVLDLVVPFLLSSGDDDADNATVHMDTSVGTDWEAATVAESIAQLCASPVLRQVDGKEVYVASCGFVVTDTKLACDACGRKECYKCRSAHDMPCFLGMCTGVELANADGCDVVECEGWDHHGWEAVAAELLNAAHRMAEQDFVDAAVLPVLSRAASIIDGMRSDAAELTADPALASTRDLQELVSEVRRWRAYNDGRGTQVQSVPMPPGRSKDSPIKKLRDRMDVATAGLQASLKRYNKVLAARANMDEDAPLGTIRASVTFEEDFVDELQVRLRHLADEVEQSVKDILSFKFGRKGRLRATPFDNLPQRQRQDGAKLTTLLEKLDAAGVPTTGVAPALTRSIERLRDLAEQKADMDVDELYLLQWFAIDSVHREHDGWWLPVADTIGATAVDATVAAANAEDANEDSQYMFSPQQIIARDGADALKGWRQAPLKLVTWFGIIPDYHLHVLRTRGYIGKHLIHWVLELSQLLDSFKTELSKAGDEWKFPTAASGQQTVFSCMERQLDGVLRIASTNRVKLGKAFQRASGRRVQESLELERSISVCLPPALAQLAEITETSWRYVLAASDLVDPVTELGLDTCSQFANELQTVLSTAEAISSIVHAAIRNGGYSSKYLTSTLHYAHHHIAKDLQRMPGCNLAQFGVDEFETYHQRMKEISVRNTAGKVNLKHQLPAYVDFIKHWAAARLAKVMGGISGVAAATKSYATASEKRGAEAKALRSCALAARKVWMQGKRPLHPTGLNIVRATDGSCTTEPTGEAPPWSAVARWATGEDACAEWSDLSAQNPVPKAALRCSKDDGVAARRNENADEGFYPTGWGIHYPAATVTVDTDDPGSFFEGVALGPPRDGEERAEDCNDCCLDDFDIIDND